MRPYFAFVIIFCFPFYLFSQATVLDGDWSSNSIWSTNSYPGSISNDVLTLNNNTVNINHNVDVQERIKLNNSSVLNVNAGAALDIDSSLRIMLNSNPVINVSGSGSDLAKLIVRYNISMANSSPTINITNGYLMVATYFSLPSGANLNLNINSGGILYVKTNVNWNNGVNFSLNSNGALLVDGNFNVNALNGNKHGKIMVNGVFNGSNTNLNYHEKVEIFSNSNLSGVHDNRPNGSKGLEGNIQYFADNYPNICKYSIACCALMPTCGSHPLPVEFYSFFAAEKDGITTLFWSTLSEQNSSSFKVEKSTDLTNWEQVGEVQAAGTSKSKRDYEFDDLKINLHDTYYRLKQTDLNDDYTYSELVYVAKKSTPVKELIYPNPAKGYLFIEKYGECVPQKILNEFGHQQEVLFQKYLNGFRVDVSHLRQGVYFLALDNNSKIDYFKFQVK